MPRANRKTKPGKRGYRKRLTAPKKRQRPYRGKKCTAEGCGIAEGWASVSFTPVPSEDVRLVTGDEDSSFQGFDTEPSVEGMKVLSVFDGIGAAKVVLDRLEVPLAEYFSSEVDEKAISVLKRHYFNKMTMLGCVKSIRGRKLAGLGRIHLLLGGSPCENLSLVNNKHKKGLKDTEHSGSLFYEFVRLRDSLQAAAETEGHCFYWLFENTSKMQVDDRDEISRCLACDPVYEDSCSDTAMHRLRCFWGNTPELQACRAACAIKPTLQDFLMPYRTALVDVMPTLTTTGHSQLTGPQKKKPVMEDGQETKLLIIEEERLFGFPVGYTDVNLSPTDRRALLGRSWCIPTVEKLLRPLAVLVKEGKVRL